MIRLGLQVIGLEEVMQTLTELQKLGSEYTGANLMGIERHLNPDEGSVVNNAMVLEHLHSTGRKFGLMFPDQISLIARAGADIMRVETEKAFRKAQRAAKSKARELGASIGLFGKELKAVMKRAADQVSSFERSENWAKQTAAKLLRECMKVYMGCTLENIEKQKAIGGVKQLSPPYAKWKKKKYGFTHPIGKLTGQLTSNLDRTFVSGRIRLTKK